MWLEKTVMFPALHSIIRDVLSSDENVKVQFILEPLAFPMLSNCFQFYGQRFIDQLSYLTRTFVFYIDREYQKITKLPKNQNDYPPLVPNNDYPNYDDILTNPTSIPVIPSSTPPPTLTRCTNTQHQPYQNIEQHDGCHQYPDNMYFHSTLDVPRMRYSRDQPTSHSADHPSEVYSLTPRGLRGIDPP